MHTFICIPKYVYIYIIIYIYIYEIHFVFCLCSDSIGFSPQVVSGSLMISVGVSSSQQIQTAVEAVGIPALEGGPTRNRPTLKPINMRHRPIFVGQYKERLKVEVQRMPPNEGKVHSQAA